MRREEQERKNLTLFKGIPTAAAAAVFQIIWSIRETGGDCQNE
jgi:hypothetical protein